MRNRLFLFFSVVMPMIFLFLFLGIFARGDKAALPATMAQVIALTVMGNFWGLSVQLVTFREQGILRRFHVAPVGAAAMLASSILSNIALTLPTIVVEFLVARWMFHLMSIGNIITVIGLVVLGVVCFASLGLIIASVTNTMQETQVINQLIWFGFLFISGATVPLFILPVFVQKFAVFLPATYLVTSLQAAMARHAGFLVMIPALVSLIGTTLIAFVLSTLLFRWEPEEKATRKAKLWATATIVPFILLGAWELSYGNLLQQARSFYQPIDLPGQSAPTNNSK